MPTPLKSGTRPRVRHPDICLVLILLLGTGLRLLYVGLPIADAHRWRQIENASIARSFANGPFDILHPQVNWGGPRDAYVEMEFPLLQAIIGVGYRMFGEGEVLARLVIIGFSVATIVAVYALGRHLFTTAAGRAAAFLMAISPSAVYFGRALMVDMVMIFFSVVALLYFVKYFDTGRHALAILAGLTWLVKIPALLICAPIFYAGWQARRWSIGRDPWFILSLAVAFAGTVGWYWHASQLYKETELTLGVWGRIGAYPPDIAAHSGPALALSRWSTWETLTDLEFFQVIFRRMWTLHLTPPGFALAAYGLATSMRVRGSGVAYVWAAAAGVFIFAVGEGNLVHEYYQLVLVPPAALFFGLAAAPAFDGSWIRKQLWPNTFIVVGVTVASLGLVSFHFSGVIRSHFRPNRLDMRPIAAGTAIRQTIEPEVALIVVENKQGGNCPILLHHADRRGWSFDLQSISPQVMEHLHTRFGGVYFATTIWSDLVGARPDVTAYLRAQQRVALKRTHHNTALFKLK